MRIADKYSSVTSPYWDEVFIVGGGRSLEGFDFTLLKDKFTVGVNDAAFAADTNVVFSLDKIWCQHRTDKLRKSTKEIHLAMPNNYEYEKFGVEHAKYYLRGRGSGLSTRPEILNGLNSGFGALNLAFLKRAKVIILLGFDMKVEGKVHWHKGYNWSDGHSNKKYQRWAKDFNNASVQLKQSGILVYNTSLDSYLQCFKKRSIYEFITEVR